jgi:hypothetical protein
LKRALVGVLFAGLLGCASTSSEVGFKKIQPGQRVYVGQIKVTLNGAPATECELSMRGDLVPSMKFSGEGYIIYRSDREAAGFDTLKCFHKLRQFKAAWHSQVIRTEAFIRPTDSSTVTYFGHVTADWTFDPMTSESAPVLDPQPGPNQIGQVKGSGEIKVSVQDQIADLEVYQKEHWKILDGKKIVSNLVEPKDLKQ